MTAIAAASIGSLDLEELSKEKPEVAAEIRRLDQLMRLGEEADEEFLLLVRLMCGAGQHEDTEYLLRRNFEYSGGEELYRLLFGTAKQDEFADAIRELALEFDLKLDLVQEVEFLDQVFHSVPIGRTPRFNVLKKPCGIQITFDHKDSITAEVTAKPFSPDRRPGGFDLTRVLFLRWKAGRWRLIDWRDA